MNSTILTLDIMAEEIIKCANDPVYFIENYYYINHPVNGRRLLKLNQSQRDTINQLHFGLHSVILGSRQVGKTAIVCAYLLWRAMFNPYLNIVIGSRNLSSAADNIDRIRFAIHNLPDYLKPELIHNTKTYVEFSSGTRIASYPVTERLGRGMAISILYIDELAFIPSYIKEALWHSILPCLSTGAQFIAASTPNGRTELFYRLWEAAMNNKNNMLAIKMLASDDPAKGEKYFIDMRNILGERKFREEILCEFVSN